MDNDTLTTSRLKADPSAIRELLERCDKAKALAVEAAWKALGGGTDEEEISRDYLSITLEDGFVVLDIDTTDHFFTIDAKGLLQSSYGDNLKQLGIDMVRILSTTYIPL